MLINPLCWDACFCKHSVNDFKEVVLVFDLQQLLVISNLLAIFLLKSDALLQALVNVKNIARFMFIRSHLQCI